MPTGELFIANSTATSITTKLSPINKSPIANLIGKEGSRLRAARFAHTPAKMGANTTTNIGLKNCSHPTGIM